MCDSSGIPPKSQPTGASTASRSVSLFTRGAEYLELPDTAHDGEEDRLIAIGPVSRGVVMVVFTERYEDTIRIISALRATRTEIVLYRQHLEGQP